MLFMLLVWCGIATAQSVWYVNQSAAGANNGSSWANAFTDLQTALSQAQAGDDVWVAQGTYRPGGPGSERSVSFQLSQGVRLYGGFAGTETAVAQREWKARPTVLSGDLSGDDDTFSTATQENARTVVKGANNATLDGFTFTQGYNGNDGQGAGLYCSNVDNMLVANCRIARNTARAGAGVYVENQGDAIVFENCVFYDNDGWDGGGVHVYNTSPSFRNCFFALNQVYAKYASYSYPSGGAAYLNQSNASFENCVFTMNYASYSGGAISISGYSFPNFAHCTITGNRCVGAAGAVHYSGYGHTEFVNSVVWGNMAGSNPMQIYAHRSDGEPAVLFTHTNIEGGLDSVDINTTRSLIDGGGNLAAAPLFIDSLHPEGLDRLFGTEDDGLRLAAGSPLFDQGSSANIPASDALGAKRSQGGAPDLGAYEAMAPSPQAPLRPLGVIYVKTDATGANDGSSWQNAFSELRDALSEALPGDEIWVAKGTYKPGDVSAPRSSTFGLKRHLRLYGGFAGAETGREQRDIQANPTILSGDLLGDDDTFTTATRENAAHVVTGAAWAMLDGFTVTAGNAWNTDLGNAPGAQGGGGMFNNQWAGPVYVANCFFTKNWGNSGAGLYNENNVFEVADCVFFDNVGEFAGGLYSVNAVGSIERCHFLLNQATGVYHYYEIANAGALYINNGSARVANSVFAKNHGKFESGAVTCNGNTQVDIVNCVFSDNHTNGRGGALYQNNYGQTRLINCVLWDNLAEGGGWQVVSLQGGDPSRLVLTNCNIQGGIDGIDTPATKSLCDGGGNIALDPMFIDAHNPDGLDRIFGTADDGLQSAAGGPCLDAGVNSGTSARDIRQKARVQNGVVDMGAYEGAAPSISQTTVPASVIYVSVEAVGANNGSSWENAFTDLQDALAAAGAGDEIWVAGGTYRPGEVGAPRDVHFQMKRYVKMFGGFAGSESDRSTRDWNAHPTILCGDLNGDDSGSANKADNAYHVVQGADFAILDGFTVRRGMGKVDVEADYWSGDPGGGMSNYDVSPLVVNCVFRENRAVRGGGIYNAYGRPVFRNCAVVENVAEFGGGVYNDSVFAIYENCAIVSNIATGIYHYYEIANTGGMYNTVADNHRGNPEIVNCVFAGNYGRFSCGAMSNNGYIFPVITNCVFYGNSSGESGNTSANGGAIANHTYGQVRISNSIISGNSCSGSGQQIYNYGTSIVPSLLIDHSILQGGVASIHDDHTTKSLIDAGGNLESLPVFLDSTNPAGADGVLLTADDGLRLLAGSAGLDVATSDGAPNHDITGAARPQGSGVEMGAYEGPSNMAWLRILSPASESAISVNSTDFGFAGKAWADGAVANVVYTLSGATTGTGTASGTTDWSVADVILNPGLTIVTVTANASTGQPGSDIVAVYCTATDNVSPDLAILTPSTAASLRTPRVAPLISGVASDNIALAELRYSLFGATTGSGALPLASPWTLQGLVLNEGETTVVVTARDVAGNQRNASIVLRCGLSVLTDHLLEKGAVLTSEEKQLLDANQDGRIDAADLLELIK
jgi:hypothetical protein